MHPDQAEHDEWLGSGDEEAALDPTLRIVDAHHHLWYNHPTRTWAADYMLREIADDIARSGHNVTHTCYVQSNSAGWCVRPAGTSGGSSGRDATVTESEVAQGIAAMAESGRYGPTLVNAGIVATCDLTRGADADGGVEPALAAHAAVARNFRGVRYLGGRAEHIDFADPAVLSALGALDRRGVVFDCNGPESHPLDFEGVLGEAGLAAVARKFPTLQIVLDHCGGAVGPACFESDPSKRGEWERCLRRLASFPNVAVKVGGLHMRGNGFPIGPTDVRRPLTSEGLVDMMYEIYAFTIKTFGAERCMFESNFPVDRWGTTYRVLWNTFKRVAERMDLSIHEKEAIFSGTATRIYQLETS